MSKKTILISSSLAAALILLVFLGLRWKNSGEEKVAPKRGPIIESIYALGKVKSRHQYDLKIGVLSTVEKLYSIEGDTVRKGDPLIKFADTNLFRAPFDGVVTMVAVDEGEPGAPSTTLLRVDDMNDKYIEVSLEQQGALRVQRGQTAMIVFESLRGEKLEGKVTSLYAKNDEFLAKIEVPGLKENVLPGMTADVAIVVGRYENALLIPVKGVTNGQVSVLREGTKLRIPVKIGAIDSQWAQVLEGDVKDQDLILVGKK